MSSSSAVFADVPVIEVHRNNYSQIEAETQLSRSIQAASFVALDCELSGLGERRGLSNPSIDDRFLHVGRVAQTRSIIAMGISCFKLIEKNKEQEEDRGEKTKNKSDSKHWDYQVQTYNVLSLCDEDYIVEPTALSFLVDHGFDFQRQYSTGMRYKRGNQEEDFDPAASSPLRSLFTTLIQSETPLVLHNGFVDLVFLYQNFYAQIPSNLASFVADLMDLFPGGIYDTKYLADYVTRTPASYLEYVFRKEQSENEQKFLDNRPHVRISFPTYSESCDFVEFRHCPIPNLTGHDTSNTCDSYANHGHCSNGNSCPKSHDVDLILHKRRAGRKRKKSELGSSDSEFSSPKKNGGVNGNGTDSADKKKSGAHRAGYDAFMTGFAFATMLVHHTKIPERPESFRPAGINAQDIGNKVYLVGKEFPLLIAKSSFAKNSLSHHVKFKKLRKTRNGDQV